MQKLVKLIYFECYVLSRVLFRTSVVLMLVGGDTFELNRIEWSLPVIVVSSVHHMFVYSNFAFIQATTYILAIVAIELRTHKKNGKRDKYEDVAFRWRPIFVRASHLVSSIKRVHSK